MIRHHLREYIYESSALCTHNITEHFVAHGRIICLITILTLEVLLSPISDLMSEFCVAINKVNLLQHTVDYLAEVQTEIDVLVICIDLLRCFNSLSCFLSLANIL